LGLQAADSGCRVFSHQPSPIRLSASAQNLRFVPAEPRQAICHIVEWACGKGLLKYYEIPRLLLAPNPEIKQWLESATGRPCRLMPRGVDIDLFNPSRRDTDDGIFRFGCVGTLTQEKNLRLLVQLERALADCRETRYRFLIVGHGNERAWLEEQNGTSA
jgi:glycosyltransferase involved in cell wall biosynthesis